MKLILLTLLFGAATVFAADYDADFARLAGHAARQSTQYWQGEHFGEKPYPADAAVYDGRNVHDYTMMYWNFLNAALNGDTASQERALKHYQFTSAHFWDTGKKRFRTGYDFLSNTSIAMSILLSLRDAREMIPQATRDDMRGKIRDIALYLPTYTTALTNNNDLRANNQDAFAAFALALAAEELKEPQIRKNALEKFRAILAVVQQSFWIEGGVDTGYQSVGEAAFMNAADLLWDDLTAAERVKVADLQLNAHTANGFGIENARSPSWINRQPVRAVSTGLLTRVPNGFLAADAEGQFLEMAQKGFSSKWWLHDPAALSLFTGFYKNRAAIAVTPKLRAPFAAGSLACQIMERDEQKSFFSGMEKAYLTGVGGVTAIFGDYTRLHPEQQLKKFGAAYPPHTLNPGGLRYIGKGLQFFVAPDDTLGAPRLFSTDRRRVPQLFSRRSFPGAGVSEYVVSQVFPGLNEMPPETVTQSFAAIGDVVLAAFVSDGALKGISYGVTVPFRRVSQQGNRTTVEEIPLTGAKSEFLDIFAFGAANAVVGKERWKPYFKNEITVAGERKKLPELRLLDFAFEGAPTAVLVLAPGRGATKVSCERSVDRITVRFESKRTEYLAVCVLKPMAKLETDEFVVSSPMPGYWQVAGKSKAGFQQFAFRGTGATLGGAELFRADAERTLSGTVVETGWLVNGDAGLRLGEAFGTSAQSLVDGRRVTLPGKIETERLLIVH